MKEHIHVVGVAGVGMNPLAQMLLNQGFRVSGSDRFADQGRGLPILKKLAGLGVELGPQDGKLLTKQTKGVVISTAIEADNPERVRADELGIPVIHRAEMLARFANAGQGIAIAGTAGKTTTTGITAWLLEQCDLDPNVVNGAGIVNWMSEESPGNVRSGKSDLWLYEADESDRSFLNFQPDWAIITNIDQDHFSLEESIELFRQFASQVKRGIICSPAVAKHLKGADLQAKLIKVSKETFEMSLLGEHNQANARHAVALCETLGANPAKLREALKTFAGIERRLECIAPEAEVLVFDDYGHNPAKIAAAWNTVAAAIPGRVHGVWRPHGFGPLKNNLDAFAQTFNEVIRQDDQLYLMPVFYVGGTADSSVSSDDLADLVPGSSCAESYAEIQKDILARAQPGDAVLFMGARDPDLPTAARNVAAALQDAP